jgi:hypothetical protein
MKYVQIHKFANDICNGTRIVFRGWEYIQRPEGHSGGVEHSILLRCYTMLLGEQIPTFRRIFMLSSSGPIILIAVTTLKQAGNCLVVDTN